jgi:hypothetical protein
MTMKTLMFLTAVIGVATATGLVPQGAKTKPVQGAVQMPGDNGKVGTPYMLGKKGEELVFTLEKAEFASRLFHKQDGLFPDPGKRLLILTYAVQNPSSTGDRLFFNQSFSFTVVSPDDENFVCDGATANGMAAIHPERRDRLSIQLKPAQKVRALVAIEMHPKGPVNKLIVQRGKGNPVLRYDLKEKVSPMSSCFAASEGLDMRDTGAALMTQNVDLGPWDIVVEKMSEEPAAIGPFSIDSGHKYVVLTVSIKNASMTPYPLHRSLILTKVTDVDGGDLPETQYWAKGSSPEAFPSMTIEPGAQVRVRMLYNVTLLTKLAKVTFRDQQYSSRAAAVKLEEPKKDPPPRS